MSRMFRHDRTPHNERSGRAEGAPSPEDRDELADDADLDEYDDSADDDEIGEDDTALEDDSPHREAADTRESSEAAAEGDYASGPDDTLGLYLRQMGAIPLLTRDKELSLAQRLEYHRDRFRAAALLCPRVQSRMVEKFEQIAASQTPLDPNIDVYSSEELRLSRLQIVARLGSNLPTLKALLDHETRGFAAGVRDEVPGPAAAWDWDRFRRRAERGRGA